MIVAGPLTDAIGARWVFVISAGCASLGAVVGFLLLRSARPAVAERETEPEALSVAS
jgi:zinc transporter ZupT